MRCKELIDVMAVKGIWKSLGGQTPWGTLHSANAREITEKGKGVTLPKSPAREVCPKGALNVHKPWTNQAVPPFSMPAPS